MAPKELLSEVVEEPLLKSPRSFTWKELSKLNTPQNAHVAVRGKVSAQGVVEHLLRNLE